MTTDDFYDKQCRPPYIKKQYGEARKKLAEFFCLPDSSVFARIKARLAMATCIVALMEKNGSDQESVDEFNLHLSKYLQELKQNDKPLAAVPFIEYFGQVIRFVLTGSLGEIETTVSTNFIKFLISGREIVSREELIHVWISEIDRERRSLDVLRSDHTQRAIILAETLLCELKDDQSLKEYRITVNKMIADIIYYYHTPGKTHEDRCRQCLSYLSSVLNDAPGDPFALNFKEDIESLMAKRSQIERFVHDARSMLGSMNVKIQKVINNCSDDFEYYSDLLGLRRHISALRAVAMLVESDEDIIQPSGDEYEEHDIYDIIVSQLEGYGWPVSCIEREGDIAEWEIIPGMITVVFDNLLKNTSEAYNRKNIKKPKEPCLIRINYDNHQIEYRDFAGGVDQNLGDIFEPYRTSKGVQSKVGLGLANVKRAMKLQEFNICLSDNQPENGALFILNFS